MGLYDFSATLNNGKEKKLSAYKGKVLLIVNTASKCGFTPQYEGLQKLYAKYRDQDFDLLAFPCDQFGHQEPGSDYGDQIVLRAELWRRVPALLQDRCERLE